MLTNCFKTFLLFLIFCTATFLHAQLKTDFPVAASVEPDSGKEAIKVMDLKLDFKFAEAYLASLRKLGLSENPNFKFTAKQIRKYSEYAIIAMRCNILGYLIQEPYRKLSTHIAESGLLQQFCQ